MTHRSAPSRADPALEGAESFLFFVLGAQSEQPEPPMTLPNRPNYVPGEKWRERKCQPDDEPAVEPLVLPLPLTKVTLPPLSAIRPVVEVTRPMAQVAVKTEAPITREGSSRPKEDKPDAAPAPTLSESELHQELLDALATFLPESASNGVKAEERGDSASAPARQRAEVEAAWKRLHADPYFQAHGKQLLAFREDDGRGKSSTTGPVPSWDVATHPNAQGGSSDNFSVASLQQVKKTMMQELQAVLDKIQDPSVAEGYQQAINDFHQWGMQRLIQQQHQLQQQLQQRPPAPLAPPPTGAATSPTTMSMAAMFMPQQAKKRVNLSKNAKTVLRAWFDEHLHHPYPTEEEKEMLSRQGGLTLDQVNNWFINTRGRKWKPMISKLMAQKKVGECPLYDRMVQKIEEPYRSDSMSDLLM